MENERTKKKKTRRKILWGRVIIFVFVLALIGMGFYMASYHTYQTGKSVYQEYNTMFEEFEQKQSLQAKFASEKFNDYTNILLLGIDDGDQNNAGRRSDAIIVASVNNETGFINLLSVPRDTKVNIPGRKTEEKINQAYYYGGVQLSVRTVEELLQIPIQQYVVIDMKVFSEIIDQLGGIYFYIERDMDYEDPYAALAIHLKRGYQYLSGNEAANYIRYRSDELGDIGRVQRQQKFMKALYAEVFKLDTLAELPKLWEIVNRRLTTSFSVLDAAHLAKSLRKCDSNFIKTEMLPGKILQANGNSYWSVDVNALTVLREETFKKAQSK